LEIIQGKFLCIYLYLKQAKMSFFNFFFFFYKIREYILPREGGRVGAGASRGWGKGIGG
jgi:hypothetical protein